ncbi:MFS transporter [Streptomyces abyssalis]|uniref:MFS transporter n=1 Tax=Streptomyces abyssalis TaxID=933944 RepID=A0A1E7JKJ0_9ACTN|nr:MFS transporter [Streptomyces abyssalis]OEU88139.1 MFS transporter [Streptomyces abyssalis]OEU91010.1 MFS transporter [Streptomyces abyssalis]
MSTVPRSLLPDLSPWRSSRDYRLMWCAGAVTVFGSFLTFVALPLQMKELTDSTVAVGALGAVELVPLIVFGLYGGALADAVDRRKLIVGSEAALGLVALCLLANSLVPHPAVWPLYAAAALTSALTGIQRPALDALLPRVVAHEQLAAAAALNSLRWQLGAVLGPSLAGLLLAGAGVRTAYALDVVTFAVSVLLGYRLRPAPPGHEAARPSLRGIAEGARYAWSRKELLGTYAVDIAATLFAFPIAVFPFLAEDLGAEWSLGLMYAALPFGSMLVSATSGWTGRVHCHGRAVAGAAMCWGAAMAVAGWMTNVWLVLLFLTVAGGCDMVSGIFRSTMWNQTIPDGLRGRLAGIELLSYSAGPQLGQVRSGGVAALTSVRTSVWSGGLACVAAVGLLTLALPKLMSYDSRTDPHARHVREQRAAGPVPPEPDAPAPGV